MPTSWSLVHRRTDGMVSMKKQFLEVGKIVNTHGVHGQVKITPWTSRPDFLCAFEYVYLDGKRVGILSSSVHKDYVIAALEGIASIDDAIPLKNKILYIDRDDAPLQKGEHFIQDLLDLQVFDASSGTKLGVIADVLTLPSSDVYVIRGNREILIPAVPEFIREINVDEGYVTVRLIDGM